MDNGRSIHETLESWVVSGDLERARVALAYDEALLFRSAGEAKDAWSQLSFRFPQFQSDCEIVLSRWFSAASGA